MNDNYIYTKPNRESKATWLQLKDVKVGDFTIEELLKQNQEMLEITKVLLEINSGLVAELERQRLDYDKLIAMSNKYQFLACALNDDKYITDIVDIENLVINQPIPEDYQNGCYFINDDGEIEFDMVKFESINEIL